jgi:putative methionine-R-sulfoxide reductase with GAF domain
MENEDQFEEIIQKNKKTLEKCDNLITDILMERRHKNYVKTYYQIHDKLIYRLYRGDNDIHPMRI